MPYAGRMLLSATNSATITGCKMPPEKQNVISITYIRDLHHAFHSKTSPKSA